MPIAPEKYLFVPGPVKMSPDILALGAVQPPYFRNQAFSEILRTCERHLLTLAHAPEGSRVIFLTASGTAAMEASVINLLTTQEQSIVINGGSFGQRFVDICHLHQRPIYNVKVNATNLANTDSLETFKEATALLINAHETSIGLLYDLKAIGAFCKKYKLLNIVDAISLFVTDEIDMQAQAIDALILSSHKGLALPPGLAMVILSPKALQKVKSGQSYYFDFQSHLDDGLRGQTPFTPAITIILQLHLRLSQIMARGIQAEQHQVKVIADYFRAAITPLPLKPYSPYMPNAMTALTPLDAIKASDIVAFLDSQHNVIVAPNGGDLKEKLFRVAHMGDMTEAYTDILINALFDFYQVQR
ncbi:MAG: alanine--glyoxylate aminotransferase family protein [Methylococcaceae bacterium]|nr:alanine--glyoxylate aminotransferase family protein [Methylococcaceae bacterium]